MNKFDQYVFGHPNVTIHSGRRPLEAIMRKSLLAAPNLIQAMMLTLQRYAFTVKWKPGKEQVIADLLSRHTGNCEQPAESAEREHVFQVQQHETRCRQYLFEIIDPTKDCPVTNTLYVTIKKETERDQVLQQLSEIINNGWPKDVTIVPEQVRPLWTFRDELAILDGVAYKGPRVVIPTSIPGDMVERLHVSHQGIEATLRRARQTMFRHGMAVDVKQNIANCNTCSEDAPGQTKETLHSHIPHKTARSTNTKPWISRKPTRRTEDWHSNATAKTRKKEGSTWELTSNYTLISIKKITYNLPHETNLGQIINKNTLGPSSIPRRQKHNRTRFFHETTCRESYHI